MNRPWKIVVADAPYPDTQPIFDAFAKAGNCEVTLLPEGTSRVETFQVCKDADAVLFAYFEVNEEFLSTLQRCRVISRFGIGMNTIDIPACTRHGIYVANVRTPQIRDVANHALTFILACAKKLTISNEMVRHGIWSQDPVVPIYQLTNKVVGLVGFGQIARQVAKRVVACDMQVISYDPFVDEETMKQAGVRKVSMEELLETADFVSLHLPYTKETEKTINTAAFDRMKETAYLINTARGGLVDEAAMIEALREKKIAGVGIDVLVDEHPPADHPIFQFKNAIITPHAAWYSEECLRDLLTEASEQAIQALRGGIPTNLVNVELAETK